MQTVKIKKSWFYSAGDKYNWNKDNFDRRGVGISKTVLVNNKDIIVEIDHGRYKLDCQKAIEFIKKYQSKQILGGVIIGIVSKTLLEEIK